MLFDAVAILNPAQSTEQVAAECRGSRVLSRRLRTPGLIAYTEDALPLSDKDGIAIADATRGHQITSGGALAPRLIDVTASQVLSDDLPQEAKRTRVAWYTTRKDRMQARTKSRTAAGFASERAHPCAL